MRRPTLPEIVLAATLSMTGGYYFSVRSPQEEVATPTEIKRPVIRKEATRKSPIKEPQERFGGESITEETTRLILQRDTYTANSTTGELYLDRNSNGKVDMGDEHLAYTLELPWRNNQRNISSIPQGDYNVSPRTSQKLGQHFHVEDVSGRTYIMIHAGNSPKDTEGCILVGETRQKDYVKNSKETLRNLRSRFENDKLSLKVTSK